MRTSGRFFSGDNWDKQAVCSVLSNFLHEWLKKVIWEQLPSW